MQKSTIRTFSFVPKHQAIEVIEKKEYIVSFTQMLYLRFSGKHIRSQQAMLYILFVFVSVGGEIERT